MKIIPRKTTYEEGFSLVEILVAITISTIMIGFTFGIYLFGQRFFVQWQDQLFLQNELHTLSQGITEELFQADRIKTLEPQNLIIQSEDKEKHYEVRNDTLFVNDKTILNPSVTLVNFRLSARGENDEQLDVGDPKKIGDVTFVKFAFALSDGRDTLHTTRTIHLRKPSNWNFVTKN